MRRKAQAKKISGIFVFIQQVDRISFNHL